MDIKDYLKEQINYGADLDDIIDDVEAAYNDLKEKKTLLNQKKLDAQFLGELELDFVKKYYPELYEKYYKDTTKETWAEEFIEAFDLADDPDSKLNRLIDDLFSW